jgi:hypothetical protein
MAPGAALKTSPSKNADMSMVMIFHQVLEILVQSKNDAATAYFSSA